MAGPKPAALPLGDTPSGLAESSILYTGWKKIKHFLFAHPNT
jgi:hypothetical protein